MYLQSTPATCLSDVPNVRQHADFTGFGIGKREILYNLLPYIMHGDDYLMNVLHE
jgi:hypothetical protein